MNTTEEKASANVPESSQELQKEIDRLLGDITVKLLGDEQRQQTVRSIADTVMSAWSAGNPIKRFLSFLALKTWPGLPPAEYDRLADIAADLGRLMKFRWKLQAQENRENPTASAENLAAALKAFLDNTDISCWKEMLDSSKPGRLETARQLNELLAEYQGKLMAATAALPTVISIAANSLKSYLETQLKIMPPEMVFEVFSGLNANIDWKEVGRMLNDRYELIRRIHIGSSLSGDGVNPAVRNLVGDMLKGIVGEIDPRRYAEAVAGKAEDREAVKNAVSDMMRAFPDFGKSMLIAAALSRNARIRSLKNRLQVLGDLAQRDMGKTVGELTEAFDEHELADLISLMAEVTNNVHAADPDGIPQTVSDLIASINLDEVREMAENNLIRDIIKAVKPLALPLMPPLIHGLCDLLEPDPEETEPELQVALTRLSSILGADHAD
jgi:hypothetical protein